MPSLKPWYRVITPREDLREGKPLDASEFAVHLDQVRDGRAPTDYQKPERFFDRTYLTQNLLAFAAEVVRRLSGIQTETSAVFNLTTQFGGGKTHFLTLLYHLARKGLGAERWAGVQRILDKAGVPSVPSAATAVFAGTEFDSITGRGGSDGTPLRRTPWGEIAFQLAGEAGLAVLAEHEKQMTAPAGDVIRRFLPKGKPCLILIDELMNYVSRNRKSGMASQLYSFLHNLSEEARAQKNLVLAVSVPASELEMSAEDQSDYERFKKLLDRLGKAVIMAAESETSEIIRRRLFDWDGVLDNDGKKTVAAYAEWVVDHRLQVPSWFPTDHAREAFAATYPFHPMTLSVFERKWQALPRFQKTRGILRLLALWVSRAYVDGFKGAHHDALIGLGTAPLDDSLFRSAAFEQIGASRLEGAVTTDICGKKESHAVRLDKEAEEAIRKARLHRKVGTVIFFESNGGQARAEATVPEIRLAVAEPELDVGHVDTVLEAMAASCYYLTSERNRYRFSLSPNLNKLLADRRASIAPAMIEERVRAEVQKVFADGPKVERAAREEQKPILERTYFPEKSNQVPDRPVLTFAILALERSMEDEKKTVQFVETMTREYGASGRTFKSALIWCVPDSAAALRDEARKLLAWEDIQDEHDQLRLDDSQKRQLTENVKKAQRDLKEAVWRTYKHVLLLGKDNALQDKDLGLVHSSAANDLVSFIVNRLRGDSDVEPGVSPTFLVRHWPGFPDWTTKAVRDAFFASPLFPRLLNAESVKETIARGVENGILAYVGKGEGGRYEPFHFGTSLDPHDVEISDEMFVITADEARKHIEPPRLTTLVVTPAQVSVEPGKKQSFMAKGLDQHQREIPAGQLSWTATGGTIDQSGVFGAAADEGSFLVTAKVADTCGIASVTVAKPGTAPVVVKPLPVKDITRVSWEGEIPPQKWMNFYTKVLSRFAAAKGLKLTVKVETSSEAGISVQKIEETRIALRELGLDDNLATQS
ncbi:MAG TPA: DUF499 domain-containing protein [Gemmataceae bacterium]|jgi:hypothetical protein|nr:DUF499 domain-containing protein [Gemmataceae bacterium]